MPLTPDFGPLLGEPPSTADPSSCPKADLSWALTVMDGVMLGKVSVQDLEWNPMLAVTDNAWFLPRTGEWMPPLTRWEMGLPETVEPAWDLTGVVVAADKRRDIVYCEGDITLRLTDFDKLWRLLVMYVQAPADSWEQASAVSFIRSIGWSLFFWHGSDALFDHSYIVIHVAQNKIEYPPEDSPVNEHLRSQGRNATEEYRQMGMGLRTLWDKIGDWVVVDMVPKTEQQREEYARLVEEDELLASRLMPVPHEEGADRGRREDNRLAELVAEGVGVLEGDAGRREGDQFVGNVAEGAVAREGGVDAGRHEFDQPTRRVAEGEGVPERGEDAGRREEDGLARLVPEGKGVPERRADAGRRAGDQLAGSVAEGAGVPEGRLDAGRRDGVQLVGRVAEGAGVPEGGLDSARRAASFRPSPLGIAVRCAWMSLTAVAIGSAWC